MTPSSGPSTFRLLALCAPLWLVAGDSAPVPASGPVAEPSIAAAPTPSPVEATPGGAASEPPPVAPCIECTLPYRGNPARTGEFAGPDLLTRPKVGSKYRVRAAIRAETEPAIAGGAAYLNYGVGFNKLFLNNKYSAWHVPTGERAFVPLLIVTIESKTYPPRVTPFATRELAYIGGVDGVLTALDQSTGQPRWTLKTRGAIENAPTVWDGALYFNNDAGELFKADPATGKVVWRFMNAASARATLFDKHEPFTQASLLAPPAFCGGALYLPSCFERRLYALNPADGSVRWTFEADGNLPEAVACAGGTLYFTSVRRDGRDVVGTLYAVDAATGQARWSAPRKGLAVAPAVGADTVYLVDGEGKLLALDRHTGTPRWSAPLRGSDGAVASLGPARVYIADDAGVLHAFDRETGAAAWSVDESFRSISGPVLSEGTLYQPGKMGTLIGLVAEPPPKGE